MVSATTWLIGDVEVTAIADLDPFDLALTRLLPDADPRSLEHHRELLVPHHVDASFSNIRLAVQSFLLRVDGLAILVDTCVGEHKPRPNLAAWDDRRDTRFLDILRQAGVTADDIDVVFCTHLHADHVGWNTRLRDGRWTPTFPKARYLFGQKEYAHWLDHGSANHGSFQDSVLPIAEAKQMQLVDDGFEITRGITVTPLAGHSPGQVGLVIERVGQRALFCGDAIHSPIQIFEPDWSSAFCHDPLAAAALRHRLLAQTSADGSLLVPAHFRSSGRVHVHCCGKGYRPRFAAS